MEFDKKLWEKAIKIKCALDSLYSSCGYVINKTYIKEKLPKDVLNCIDVERICSIENNLMQTELFIIYETLRLSQTKHK